MPIGLQILLFSMLWNSILQNKDVEPIGENVEKMIEKYKSKPDISKKIDEMITNSPTFNDLLKPIREKGDQILAELKS